MHFELPQAYVISTKIFGSSLMEKKESLNHLFSASRQQIISFSS